MSQNSKMNHKQANHGLIARDLHHIRAAVSELPEIDEVILFWLACERDSSAGL